MIVFHSNKWVALTQCIYVVIYYDAAGWVTGRTLVWKWYKMRQTGCTGINLRHHWRVGKWSVHWKLLIKRIWHQYQWTSHEHWHKDVIIWNQTKPSYFISYYISQK